MKKKSHAKMWFNLSIWHSKRSENEVTKEEIKNYCKDWIFILEIKIIKFDIFKTLEYLRAVLMH